MGGGGGRVQITSDPLSGVHKLTIRRALPTDAAVYKCVVWNRRGSAASAARVFLESIESCISNNLKTLAKLIVII